MSTASGSACRSRIAGIRLSRSKVLWKTRSAASGKIILYRLLSNFKVSSWEHANDLGMKNRRCDYIANPGIREFYRKVVQYRMLTRDEFPRGKCSSAWERTCWVPMASSGPLSIPWAVVPPFYPRLTVRIQPAQGRPTRWQVPAWSLTENERYINLSKRSICVEPLVIISGYSINCEQPV